MHKIPDSYFKGNTLATYILLIPLYAFFFLIGAKPYHLDTFMQVTQDQLAFRAAIMASIEIVVTLISRLSMLLVRSKHQINYTGFIIWELLEGLEDHNMIQLAYWENGLRQFTNSKRAIEKPEDLKGLKFRTPEDKMTMAIFAAYGASASPFAFSELYLALQQGTFDGQENPVSNIYANNFQDVQKYLTMVNYQYQPKDMIFSLSTWNKLPADLQEILLDCAKEFGAEHRQAIRDNEATYLAELEAAGMEVGYPDTAPFIEQAQSVYADFYAENDWAEDLVARINELK